MLDIKSSYTNLFYQQNKGTNGADAAGTLEANGEVTSPQPYQDQDVDYLDDKKPGPTL